MEPSVPLRPLPGMSGSWNEACRETIDRALLSSFPRYQSPSEGLFPVLSHARYCTARRFRNSNFSPRQTFGAVEESDRVQELLKSFMVEQQQDIKGRHQSMKSSRSPLQLKLCWDFASLLEAWPTPLPNFYPRKPFEGSDPRE
jgi:hypothetical protein